jgi:BirA family biotin operon repressor/biotin-[acetyl-CoA-carboxylase] ligase
VLLADLLERLERYYDLLTDDEAAIRRAYTARLHGLGHPTRLRFTDQEHPVSGVVLGITDTGALRLDTADGPRTFHAGEVILDMRGANV